MLTTRSQRPGADRVDDGLALLERSPTSSPAAVSTAAVPPVASSRKPSAASASATGTIAVLVGVAHGEERGPGGRERPAGGALRLRERGRQVGGARHHLAGGAHLRPEHGVGAGEARERQHGRLDAHELGPALLGQLELVQARAGGEPDGRVDEVDAGRLARERHGARSARVHLEHGDLAVDERELDVQQADDAERGAEPADDAADLRVRLLVERRRRQDAGRVAGVDPGLLDVLHHRADVDRDAVAERVDVDLERALEEAVDERRPGDAGHRGRAPGPRRSRPASRGRRARRTGRTRTG